ncbi:MAG TPA: hypothetical protein VND93_10230 [Myxococcales bacterium]|jgi:hypothetical protein|nr:hypothetical protein [Myxococcales bacterium]
MHIKSTSSTGFGGLGGKVNSSNGGYEATTKPPINPTANSVSTGTTDTSTSTATAPTSSDTFTASSSQLVNLSGS